MARLVYTHLFLNGNPILTDSTYSIKLHQKMAGHHNLVVTCPTDALEDPLGMFAAKAKNFIGGRLSLGVLDGSLKFTGLITDVSVNKYDGADGNMIITAQSPTILLAHGDDSQSFENKSLNDIVKQATTEYPAERVKINARARFKGNINYTVQYKESDFDFLKRLAARYGEWFFYDGEVIHFGRHGGELTELTYGSDLQSFNFKLQTRPQDHTYLAYDLNTDTVHDAEMQQFAEKPPNPYINHVAQVSKKMYSKKPRSVYNHSLLQNGKSELNEVLRLKAGHALNGVVFTGNSEVPSVRLGHLISVSGKSVLIPGKEDFYGKYIITEITHTINSSGEYENSFSGVPRDIKVPQYFCENAVPMCEEQTSIVMDNNDPKGMGRVRVQFPWQKPKGEMSPWIRVSTPYAGKGKGFYVIPEIGEEALVGFENGNAEKPFMLAAMFNGKNTSGHSGPHIKGFQTQSGNKMILDDSNGSVMVQDPSGNTITMHGDGAVTISAPSSLTINSPTVAINCDDMAVEASNSVSTNAGTDISSSAGSNVSIDGGSNIKIDAGSDLNAAAGSKASIKGTSSVSVLGKRVSITGSIMANIQSGAILTVVTAGVLNITGAARNFINGAKVKVLGGKVEIN